MFEELVKSILKEILGKYFSQNPEVQNYFLLIVGLISLALLYWIGKNDSSRNKSESHLFSYKCPNCNIGLEGHFSKLFHFYNNNLMWFYPLMLLFWYFILGSIYEFFVFNLPKIFGLLGIALFFGTPLLFIFYMKEFVSKISSEDTICSKCGAVSNYYSENLRVLAEEIEEGKATRFENTSNQWTEINHIRIKTSFLRNLFVTLISFTFLIVSVLVSLYGFTPLIGLFNDQYAEPWYFIFLVPLGVLVFLTALEYVQVFKYKNGVLLLANKGDVCLLCFFGRLKKNQDIELLYSKIEKGDYSIKEFPLRNNPFYNESEPFKLVQLKINEIQKIWLYVHKSNYVTDEKRIRMIVKKEEVDLIDLLDTRLSKEQVNWTINRLHQINPKIEIG